jgi:hypothetical protein
MSEEDEEDYILQTLSDLEGNITHSFWRHKTKNHYKKCDSVSFCIAVEKKNGDYLICSDLEDELMKKVEKEKFMPIGIPGNRSLEELERDIRGTFSIEEGKVVNFSPAFLGKMQVHRDNKE